MSNIYPLFSLSIDSEINPATVCFFHVVILYEWDFQFIKTRMKAKYTAEMSLYSSNLDEFRFAIPKNALSI